MVPKKDAGETSLGCPFDSCWVKKPNWWCGHFFFPKDNIPEPAHSDEGSERDLETMRRSEMLEVPWFDLDVSILKSCLRRFRYMQMVRGT